MNNSGKSISEENKKIIIEKIENNQLEVKFELWLFRSAGSTGDGIGTAFKNLAFGGDIGKLTENLKITDNWINEGKATYKNLNGEKKNTEIKSGYSTIKN